MDYNDFKTFYTDNYLRAFNLALCILRDEEAGRDVVADAFETVWRQMATPDGEQVVHASYLLTIVRNASLDALRRKKHKDAYVELMLKQAERTVDSLQAVMEHEQKVAMVMDALDELTPRTQDIVKACYIDRKKYREAALQFQCSESAIRKHLQKAVTFLRQRFKDEDF